MLLSIQSFFGAAGATWAATWAPLAVFAVIVAILIHTVMLMLAKAFSLKELENFAMSEILQAAATFFMAVFLVVMIESALTLAGATIGGTVQCGSTPINIEGGDSVMDNAYEAIRCRLQTRAAEIAQIQGELESSAIASYIGLNTQISFFGITVFKGDWIGSLYKYTEQLRITNNLATVLLIGLNAQSQLLEYLRANMLNVFIPVGILLRSFYFTRGPGALMIALGIGMYFIFPVFYVLLDPGFTPRPPAPPLPTVQVKNFCYATMSTAVSMLSELESSGLGSTSSLGVASIRNELSKSYITLMLHPLVALFLTLVFVRYMMSVLGGDTYELTKMVTKVI